MARILYIIVIIAHLFLNCSCQSADIKQKLDTAESLMIERPDSSLSILNGIDISQTASCRNRARFALLLTQARDKNYIDETDISLINTAKMYYEESDNVRYKFLSYYYYGRILYNNGDYTHAMIAYTQAEGLLQELNDNYLAGLLYVQMGNIYRTYYDYNKSLEAYQSAYHYYSLSELESHMAYTLLDIGIAYWNIDNPKLAEEHINKALEVALNSNDEYLERMCYQNLVILYDKIGDTMKCGLIVDTLTSKYDYQLFSSGCLGSISSYYAETKNYNLSRSYFGYAWDKTNNAVDSIALFFKSSNILKRMGRTDEALVNFEYGTKHQNEQLQIALQQPILSSQKEYFKHQAEHTAYRLKKNMQICITISVIVLLLVIVVGMYARHRVLTKDLEISKYMDLATELQASIKEKEHKLSEISEHISNQAEIHNSMIKEMHGQIAELFDKQYELLDKLSNTYYETHGCSREKESIYERVRTEINKFASDKRSIAQLEKIVNTYKRNVINLIRNEIPNISDRDIKLLCYIYAGFSAKSISIFIGETTGNILTRKYRLRAKITKLNTPSMDIILQEMP